MSGSNGLAHSDVILYIQRMDKKASLKKYQEEFQPENQKLMNDDFYLIIINCFIFSLFNNKKGNQ